jgi:sodium-independent sulfate anion transporter 11
MGFIDAKIAALKQDPNLTRVGQGVVLGARTSCGHGEVFQQQSTHHAMATRVCAEMVHWRCDCGSSVGMLLLPQAMMYSALAGVPIQQALLASWLPGIIYAIMGTTKGMICLLRRNQ